MVLRCLKVKSSGMGSTRHLPGILVYLVQSVSNFISFCSVFCFMTSFYSSSDPEIAQHMKLLSHRILRHRTIEISCLSALKPLKNFTKCLTSYATSRTSSQLPHVR